MTLEEAIKRIENYGDKVANVAHQTMKEQVYAGKTMRKTGNLGGSIVQEKEGQFTWFVGSYLDYARYINNGRREVRPVNARVLHWTEGGMDIFAKRSRAVGPDNFVGRTASFVRSILRSLW